MDVVILLALLTVLLAAPCLIQAVLWAAYGAAKAGASALARSHAVERSC